MSLPPTPSPSFVARAALPRAWLLCVALVPSVLAVAQLGRLHPDEVYQSLEPAWWRAHGYGVLAWEWQVGLRNWSLPLFLSLLLRACEALGISHPVAYRAVLEVPQYGLNVWALAAVFRLAERRADAAAGFLSLLLVGLYGAWIAFAGRTMSESVSASLLLVALEALERPPGIRAGLLAGGVLGLSVVARYGSAVLVLAVLAWLLFQRQWRMLAAVCLAGTGVALGLALLDTVTWGQPLHSLWAYVDFNVLSGRAAAQFGAAPPGFYLPILARDVPLWAWVGLGEAMARQRPRLPVGLFAAGVYLAVVSFTPHKEPRFVFPAVMLLAATAAPGVARRLRTFSSPWARGGLLATGLAVGAVPFFFQGVEQNGDVRGDQFRAIVRVTRDANAHGLLIIGDGLWGVGGYFYIGKQIPWLTADTAQDSNFVCAVQDLRFNRAIAYEGHTVPELRKMGFRVVGKLGRETLLARP